MGNLDLKRKLYQQMGKAADDMGQDNLRRRYGPRAPVEDALEGGDDSESGDAESPSGITIIIDPEGDDAPAELDDTGDGVNPDGAPGEMEGDEEGLGQSKRRPLVRGGM